MEFASLVSAIALGDFCGQFQVKPAYSPVASSLTIGREAGVETDGEVLPAPFPAVVALLWHCSSHRHSRWRKCHRGGCGKFSYSFMRILPSSYKFTVFSPVYMRSGIRNRWELDSSQAQRHKSATRARPWPQQPVAAKFPASAGSPPGPQFKVKVRKERHGSYGTSLDPRGRGWRRRC